VAEGLHDVIWLTIACPIAITMSETLEKVSSTRAHGGELIKYKFKVGRVCCSLSPVWRFLIAFGGLDPWFQSAALGGLDACFNLFLPADAARAKVPVLVYLAGLTCTEDNGCAWPHL
jgi:S-formylglutathione hydrolase